MEIVLFVFIKGSFILLMTSFRQTVLRYNQFREQAIVSEKFKNVRENSGYAMRSPMQR